MDNIRLGDEILQSFLDPALIIMERGSVDRGGQAFRLLIDEGTCSGGAGAVHGEPVQIPPAVVVGDLQEGGILAADADDCPHSGHHMYRPEDLGDGLHFVWGFEGPAEGFAVDSGEGKRDFGRNSVTFRRRG